MESAAVQAAGPVTEKIGSSSGRILGWFVCAVAAVLALAALFSGPATGVLFFSIAFGLVAWVALVRPVVVLHENGVLLRNMVSDTLVPWSRVQRAKVSQTLQIDTGEKVVHGLGLSRSTRSILREQRRGAPGSAGFLGLGSQRGPNLAASGGANQEHQSDTSYHEYVESRIERLAAIAHKAEHTDGEETASPRPVVSSWAVLPLAFLVVVVVSVVLALI